MPTINWRRQMAVAAIAVLIVGSCSEAALSPAHSYALPPQEAFVSASWITPGGLILGVATMQPGRFGALLDALPVAALTDSSNLPIALAIADDPGCLKVDYELPTRLPNGRFAYFRFCSRELTNGGPDLEIFAADSTGVNALPLANLGMWNPTQFSLAPDASRGVFASSSDICSGIGFFGSTGVVPMPPVVIGTGGQAFKLSDALTASDCTSTGNADDPDWSPDGTSIAFLASPEAVGLSGQARYDAPYDIELASANGLLSGKADSAVRTLLMGLVHPTGLRWSPDSKWLAFSGQMGNTSGTWIVRANDGALRQASRVALETPTWSPDGTELVGINSPDRSGNNAQLVIVDLRSLLSGS